ncbi:hypothetical protein WLX73_12070, partial [Bordetella bronchiseptica]
APPAPPPGRAPAMQPRRARARRLARWRPSRRRTGRGGAPLAAPAPAAPPPAAPQPVSVRVDIRPWGEVWIDGRSRGVSPPLKQLSLPPGRYAVMVRNPAGPDHRLDLHVAAGQGAAIAHAFE